ncbi:MAG TPA: choice-of-anchor D domain-containing protein, partial [Pontiella sp.]|nr:choice-of-anchor D domain-containing protein [Pontiella sp.]
MTPLKKILRYILPIMLMILTVDTAHAQGNAPEMDITGNGQSIPDGDISPIVADDTEFGSVSSGSSVDHVFTIVNTGSRNLSLSGVPNVVAFEGGSSADFTVAVQPASSQVARNGGTETFTVRFTPTGSGLKTARVTVANNDADENPYDFSIQGTALAPSLTPPTVLSPPTTANIEDTTATLGGEVTDTGGASITERGVYWSTANGFTPPGQGTKVSTTGTW